MQKKISEYGSMLDSIDKVNRLLSFKLADFINKDYKKSQGVDEDTID